MNHITQEKAIELSKKALGDYLEDQCWSAFTEDLHELCNAAIEHYIAQQAATQATPTSGLPFIPWSKESEMRESWAQAAAAREPVAYFDFQEHGFYWAPNTTIGTVPVIRKVAPMPLYSEPDMYKSEPKTNTSQERVYETAKSEQVPLSDAWIRERTKQPWIFETVKQWVREIEQAHGIGGKV